MRAARAALAAAGCGLAGFGVLFLVQALSPLQLAWLAVWLAAAVAVHDGVLVPALALARRRLRRAGRRWPAGVTGLVELAAMVVGVLTLFVVPLLWAQGRGNENPTILQGDYGGRFVVAAGVVALGVLVGARLLIRRRRR